MKMAATKTGAKKPGLYANSKAKRDRIAHGSAEKMRKPATDGAPASDAFQKSTKASTTAKNCAVQPDGEAVSSGDRAVVPHRRNVPRTAGILSTVAVDKSVGNGCLIVGDLRWL